MQTPLEMEGYYDIVPGEDATTVVGWSGLLDAMEAEDQFWGVEFRVYGRNAPNIPYQALVQTSRPEPRCLVIQQFAVCRARDRNQGHGTVAVETLQSLVKTKMYRYRQLRFQSVVSERLVSILRCHGFEQEGSGQDWVWRV